jgi:hypothetical protein
MPDRDPPATPAFRNPDWAIPFWISACTLIAAVVIQLLDAPPAPGLAGLRKVIVPALLRSVPLSIAGLLAGYLYRFHKASVENAKLQCEYFRQFQAYLVAIWAGTTPPSYLKLIQNRVITPSKWLVVKFVERAIGGAFSEDGQKIEIPNLTQRMYSELLATLIAECRSRIVMSCTLKPREWFDALQISSCAGCSRPAHSCDLLPVGPLRLAFPHIRALAGSRALSRVRVVLLKKSGQHHNRLYGGSGNVLDLSVDDTLGARLTHLKTDPCYPAFYNYGHYIGLAQQYLDESQIGEEFKTLLLREGSATDWRDVNLLDDIAVYWEPDPEDERKGGTEAIGDRRGKCVMLLSGREFESIRRLMTLHESYPTQELTLEDDLLAAR